MLGHCNFLWGMNMCPSISMYLYILTTDLTVNVNAKRLFFIHRFNLLFLLEDVKCWNYSPRTDLQDRAEQTQQDLRAKRETTWRTTEERSPTRSADRMRVEHQAPAVLPFSPQSECRGFTVKEEALHSVGVFVPWYNRLHLHNMFQHREIKQYSYNIIILNYS